MRAGPFPCVWIEDVCLSHNQTVLMTSSHYHYFDFDAVTHSIKDVSVSTRQSLASSELFRIHG